ncbi:MAG: hypothetical protein MJE66_23210 [Proteobacteria bacterium]|nr:hypothetical protein [Pseudomonadota bacterium]
MTRDAIRFGTGGWRGRLGEEVTFPRARRLAEAAGSWLAEQGPTRRVLVAADGRFASGALADAAAGALSGTSATPLRVPGVTPTPVVTHALRHGRYAGALVLTASHNPPSDHGMKLFGSGGTTLPPAALREIERRARGCRAVSTGARTRPAPDLMARYSNDLRRFRPAGKASRVRVVYDAMHGAGGAVLGPALCDSGLRPVVLRADVDPTFGGVAPDPDAQSLRCLSREVRRRSADLGLATDGDADRFVATDERGRVLSDATCLALVVDHLAASGRLRGGVVTTVATGSLVGAVAESHGLEWRIEGVGFKHLAGALLGGAAQVAADESGGFAYEPFGRDKDGMLAAMLLCERRTARARPLSRCVAELHRRFGGRHWSRTALPATEARRARLADWMRDPPNRFGRERVVGVERRDGLRLELPDGFLLWRASGTESVVRVYAEARTATALRARLELGCRKLQRA